MTFFQQWSPLCNVWQRLVFKPPYQKLLPQKGERVANFAFLFALSSVLLIRLSLFTEKSGLRKWESNGGVITNFLLSGNLCVTFPKEPVGPISSAAAGAGNLC